MCKSVKLFHLLLRTEKRSWAFRKWQIDTTFVSVILTCIKRKWTLKVLCKRLISVIEFLLSCKFLAKMCKNMYELGAVNYWNMCKQKMKIRRSISKDKKRICTILTSLKWIFWTLAAFYSVLSRWSYTASIRLRFRLWRSRSMSDGVPLCGFVVVFFLYPGMLLLHLQCVWDRCHAKN